MKDTVNLKTEISTHKTEKQNLEKIFTKDEVMAECLKYFDGDSLAADV